MIGYKVVRRCSDQLNSLILDDITFRTGFASLILNDIGRVNRYYAKLHNWLVFGYNKLVRQHAEQGPFCVFDKITQARAFIKSHFRWAGDCVIVRTWYEPSTTDHLWLPYFGRSPEYHMWPEGTRFARSFLVLNQVQ